MSDLGPLTTGIHTEDVRGEPILRERTPDPCAIVIFGARGDLTQRKLVPALYNLMVEDALPPGFAVLGNSRTAMTDGEFAKRMRDAVAAHSRTAIDDREWAGFAPRLSYVAGDLDDAATYVELRQRLADLDRDHGTGGNRIYYLATAPRHFSVVVERLRQAGMIADPAGPRWSRVIVEKPIGTDLVSAERLNAVLGQALAESQTFRIDHYLGKETVQNLLVFRFANSIFEPLWNRKHIDHVQVTAAETIGIEGRGRFYDGVGVLRDIVQNHLLQVLGLVTMEPPVSFAADDVRDEKVQLFRSLRRISTAEVARDVVVGQYDGYLDEDGVSSRSKTPTFVAAKVMVDNWRWQGVPFYLRAGKGLAERVTEIAVHFHRVPLCLFGTEEVCQTVDPNVLTLRLQPEEGISLRFVAKAPGNDLSVANVVMNMAYGEAFECHALSEAYERLLLDCMRGDATLFARRDGVEQAWRFITPIQQALDAAPDAPAPYRRGSAGPAAADALMARDGRRWRRLSASE